MNSWRSPPREIDPAGHRCSTEKDHVLTQIAEAIGDDPNPLDRNPIPDGYKMKWHQMGNGRVQLRLPVGMMSDAFLCEAYVKRDAKHERRQLARFKTHLQLIRMGRYSLRGKLP